MQNTKRVFGAVGVATLILSAAALIGCDKKDGSGGNNPSATPATATATGYRINHFGTTRVTGPCCA